MNIMNTKMIRCGMITAYFEIITTKRTLIKLYFIISYFHNNALFATIYIIYCIPYKP